MKKKTEATPEPAPQSAKPDRTVSPAKKVVLLLGSLKLTVSLLAMAVFIVFAGTVAQIDHGVWTVVEEFFRKTTHLDIAVPYLFPDGLNIPWFAKIENRIFFPRAWDVPGSFYFPGGWMIGSVLLVNLLAAHSVRFKVRARGRNLSIGLGLLAVGLILLWMVVRGEFIEDLTITEASPFWRVLWRLANGGFVALALLAACWMLFRKKAGIVLVHGGIVLMLVGELITGILAVEGQMVILPGESARYIYHTRFFELAVTDTSHGTTNRVTVVPGQLLRRKAPIRHDDLPFDIEVDEYMVNSDVVGLQPGQKGWADHGLGLRYRAIALPEVSGTDADQRVDVPSARVILKDKSTGATLAKLLTTGWYDPALAPVQGPNVVGTGQPVTLDGRTYEVMLRYKRTYKPYAIHLKKFTHDKYLGTTTPKDFRSTVRLVDSTRGVDRDDLDIWMNNPMRYEGETFYQAGFLPGDIGTRLQVVRNAGWMIPYVGCVIVGTGLLAQFILHLIGFLRERKRA